MRSGRADIHASARTTPRRIALFTFRMGRGIGPGGARGVGAATAVEDISSLLSIATVAAAPWRRGGDMRGGLSTSRHHRSARAAWVSRRDAPAPARGGCVRARARAPRTRRSERHGTRFRTCRSGPVRPFQQLESTHAGVIMPRRTLTAARRALHPPRFPRGRSASPPLRAHAAHEPTERHGTQDRRDRRHASPRRSRGGVHRRDRRGASRTRPLPRRSSSAPILDAKKRPADASGAS